MISFGRDFNECDIIKCLNPWRVKHNRVKDVKETNSDKHFFSEGNMNIWA